MPDDPDRTLRELHQRITSEGLSNLSRSVALVEVGGTAQSQTGRGGGDDRSREPVALLHGSVGDRTDPPKPWLKRCEQTPGIQARACGSRHWQRSQSQSHDAGQSASAARHRSLV